MNNAIVTGANGFIGSHLVLELASKGIKVLAIGCEPKIPSDFGVDYCQNVNFCTLDLDYIHQSYSEVSRLIGELSGDTCFFHLAWQGSSGQANAGPDQQIQNIIVAAKCLAFAAKLGCKRFVNVGTVEELYFEDYISRNLWLNQDYYNSDGYFAAGKLSAHKISLIVAYLEKIEYVHAYFSVALSQDLKRSQTDYVLREINRLMIGEKVDHPASKQLYELIEVSILAQALRAISINGRNKASYYIGHGLPASLAQIFSQIDSLQVDSLSTPQCDETNTLFLPFFDEKPFVADAGYRPTPLSNKDFS